MSRSSTALAAALLLLFATLARAAELQLGYQVGWAGLPAASVALALDECGPHYRAHTEVATGGVVRALTRFSAVAETSRGSPGTGTRSRCARSSSR